MRKAAPGCKGECDGTGEEHHKETYRHAVTRSLLRLVAGTGHREPRVPRLLEAADQMNNTAESHRATLAHVHVNRTST